MLQPHIFLPEHHSSTLLLATHNIINCQLAALLLPLLMVVLDGEKKAGAIAEVAAMGWSV